MPSETGIFRKSAVTQALKPGMLDELSAHLRTHEDAEVLYSQLLLKMINRNLEADTHLSYEKHDKSRPGQPDWCNGRDHIYSIPSSLADC